MLPGPMDFPKPNVCSLGTEPCIIHLLKSKGLGNLMWNI